MVFYKKMFFIPQSFAVSGPSGKVRKIGSKGKTKEKSQNAMSFEKYAIERKRKTCYLTARRKFGRTGDSFRFRDFITGGGKYETFVFQSADARRGAALQTGKPESGQRAGFRLSRFRIGRCDHDRGGRDHRPKFQFLLCHVILSGRDGYSLALMMSSRLTCSLRNRTGLASTFRWMACRGQLCRQA